ncbi:ankyrin repeat and BTB/POZ domain-containing protein 1-like [Lineus longissimus]|uniref:ankyrin repeat and BTB/POZ domain-containing protein 1-like n=1 Tax=Lineus longissimus TaxID=88925 RepID=UPI002B4E7B26
MNTQEIFINCCRGDLARVQNLVEQKEVDLNVRDQWDSTPLYYACLCGHEELVKYLLEKGAKCEPNTFDGERCIYGALTDKIRNTLKNFKVLPTNTKQRGLYQEFLRKLLERGNHEDITFIVHGYIFTAHRCILHVRSAYFADMLQNKWNGKDEIHLTHKLVQPEAFKLILQYLYTGRMEVHLDHVEDCIRLARQCQLMNLLEMLEKEMRKIYQFETEKPSISVTVISIVESASDSKLEGNFEQLAVNSLPEELPGSFFSQLPFQPESEQVSPDVCFIVEGYQFWCHQAFFCGRSDYFKTMIKDPFGETAITGKNNPVVTVHDITPDTFIQIIFYIYRNRCEITLENVHDVLFFADLYLLPGLKKQCGAEIAKYIDVDCVVEFLRIAQLFTLPRLEDACAEFVANNLDAVIEQEGFADLIQQDAASVDGREDCDSIPIIDDIRFYITNFIQSYSDTAEANHKLNLIEDLLEGLGLDG